MSNGRLLAGRLFAGRLFGAPDIAAAPGHIFSPRLFSGRLFVPRLFRGVSAPPVAIRAEGRAHTRSYPIDFRKPRRDRDDDVLIFLLTK